MSTKAEDWELLSQYLAEGKPVDWSYYLNKYPDQKKKIEQFQILEKINHALTQTETSQEQPDTLFTWGHLKVISPIGEGAFGQVFKAYDSILERHVALKLLKNQGQSAYSSLAFMQEAKRMAKVRNPHVLAIHGANTYDGKVGLWADLITGDTLAQRDEQLDQWSYDQLLGLFDQLADALDAVHSAGLIHGDIKLSNVMIEPNQRIILMDFGAGMKHSASAYSPGQLIGSPLYMAPELFKQNNKSQPSDVYALGVLMYRMTTGQFPVVAESFNQLQQKHVNSSLNRVAQGLTKIPKRLRNLVSSLLAVEPSSRPNTQEIKAALLDIRLAPVKFKKRAVLATVMLSLLVGVLVSTAGYYQANQAKQAAIEEKNKAQTISSFLQDLLYSASEYGEGKQVLVADVLDFAALNAPKKLASDQHSLATIHDALGNSYLTLSMHEESFEQLSKGLQLKKTTLGAEHPETLQTQIKLSHVMREMGDLEESRQLINETIKLIEDKQLNLPDVLNLARFRLAELYRDEKQFDAAEELYTILLANEEDPLTARSNNSFLAKAGMAKLANDKQQPADAETYGRAALAWLEKYPKAKQTNILSAKSHIAEALLWQNKLAEAELMYEDLVASAGDIYGSESYGYLIYSLNYAGVNWKLGRYEKAYQLQIKARQLAHDIKLKNDYIRINIDSNLGLFMQSVGKYRDSVEILRNAVKEGENIYPQYTRMNLGNRNLLAQSLNHMEQFAEALDLATEINIKASNKYGSEHGLVGIALDIQAVSHRGLQQLNTALKLHEASMTVFAAINGQSTDESLVAQRNYLKTLVLAEHIEQAKAMLPEWIQIHTDALSSEHPWTQELLNAAQSLKLEIE